MSVEGGVVWSTESVPHQDPGGEVRGQCWDPGCCTAEGRVRAWGPGDLGCSSAVHSMGSHSDPGCRARGPHTDLMIQQCRAQGSIRGTRGAVAQSTGPQSDLGCSGTEFRVSTFIQGVGGRTQGPRPDPECSNLERRVHTQIQDTVVRGAQSTRGPGVWSAGFTLSPKLQRGGPTLGPGVRLRRAKQCRAQVYTRREGAAVQCAEVYTRTRGAADHFRRADTNLPAMLSPPTPPRAVHRPGAAENSRGAH